MLSTTGYNSLRITSLGEELMKKRTTSFLIAGAVVIICLGLIIFNEPIQGVLSQAKPTQPGAWQRIEGQVQQVLTAYPYESNNYSFEFTKASEERAHEGQESFVNPLSTITFPGTVSEVAPTGISYDRMHIPGSMIRTSLWREVIEGVVYDVATLISRDDESQSFLQIIDSGELIVRNIVPVPGNLGDLKILRREGNFLVIEVLGTGAILKFNFIQQKLFDSSKNVLGEVSETEVPTQPNPTATPAPNPYP